MTEPELQRHSEPMASDLCFTSGRELAESIRARKISARDVMSVFLRQIERVNPKINAIVAKLDDEKCLALADDADRRLARGDHVGPLDRKSTRLNSSHSRASRMPSSA